MARPKLPPIVLALGAVSMLMDLGTELVHSLLPAFLVGTLGAGAATVGAIEGVAEATASLLKVFSGALSDRLGKRKALALAGYGLSALVRPLFPLAATPAAVLGARFFDRLGKGIRGAPRDAMLADATPAEIRGAAFGLRQSLDTIGAIGGPVLAALGLWWLAGDVRAVLAIAILPAIAAVTVLALAVREPPVQGGPARKLPFGPGAFQGLGRPFWWAMAAAAALGLARYGEAFLLLRAGEADLSPALAPLALALMNVAYALSSYPAGLLSDAWGRRGLLLGGLGALAVANGLLALTPTLWTVAAGVLVWGLHMGLTQGVLAGLVADLAPADRRGTAFGVYHLTAGLVALPASAVAGLLWQQQGAPAALALSTVMLAIGAPILLRLKAT